LRNDPSRFFDIISPAKDGKVRFHFTKEYFGELNPDEIKKREVKGDLGIQLSETAFGRFALERPMIPDATEFALNEGGYAPKAVECFGRHGKELTRSRWRAGFRNKQKIRSLAIPDKNARKLSTTFGGHFIYRKTLSGNEVEGYIRKSCLYGVGCGKRHTEYCESS